MLNIGQGSTARLVQPEFSGVAPRTTPTTENFARIPSLEQLRRAAYVFAKPVGGSYQQILDTLEQFWQQDGDQQVRTALYLHWQLGQYLLTHPGSGRNPALASLQAALVDDICALQAHRDLPIATLTKLKAHWQLQQLNEGTLPAALMEQAQAIPIERQRSIAEMDIPAALLAPLDKDKLHTELNEALAAGMAIRQAHQFSDEHYQAIAWYCSVGYAYLNTSMRENKVLSDFVLNHAVNMCTALDQLPTHHGRLFRVSYCDDLNSLSNKLVPGMLVGDPDFLSTSTSAEFVKNMRGDKNSVIYVIEGEHNGRNIAAYSQQNQAEVLLPPASHFCVKATQRSHDRLFVLLESVNDFIPGEWVRNIATGELLGIAINGNTTSLHQTVKHAFGGTDSFWAE